MADVITILQDNVVTTQVAGADVLLAMAAAATDANAIRAETALAEIQDIAANAAEAPSIANKLNLAGDNVGANGPDLRTAIGADLAENVDVTFSGTGAQTLDLQTVARLTPIVTGYRAIADVDDTLAFERLRDAAGVNAKLTVPAGSYGLAAPFSPLAGQHWDNRAAVLTNLDATSGLFSASGVNDWTLEGGRYVGTRAASETNGTDIGISVVDCKRYRIMNPNLTGFRSRGMDFSGATDPGDRGDRGQILFPIITNCDFGTNVSAGAGAEFNTLVGPQITNCDTGLQMSAGNWQVIGGNITDNDTNGVVLTAGANHCHGQFIGVAINHNGTWNIKAVQVVNGHTFVGCHSYNNPGFNGNIWLDRCSGISYLDGRLDCVVYNDIDGSSGFNTVANNWLGPNHAWNTTTTGGLLELIRTPNYTDAGPAGFVELEAIRGTSIKQALSVPDVLEFQTVEGDISGAFNAATGEFTAAFDGQLDIVGYLQFTNASGGTSVGSYTAVRRKRTASADYEMIVGGTFAYSDTFATAQIAASLPVLAGDVVELYASIAGVSPEFGGLTDSVVKFTLRA